MDDNNIITQVIITGPITVSIAPEVEVEENVTYGSDNPAGPAQDYLVPVPSKN